MNKKYRYNTHGSGRRFYGSIARLFPHAYGAHTAHGKRTVMKPGTWIEIGCFETRAEARAACKKAIEDRMAVP